MLIHHLSGKTSKWCLASHYYPEGYAKRVQVRADVDPYPCELFRTGKLGCPGKCSGRRNARFRSRFVYCLCQAEVDNFRRYTSFLLQPHHDVCRLDITVDKVLFVNCGQTGSHLRCNFQRQFYVQSAGAFDEFFERFSLYELHRVEVTAPSSAQVQHRGNVRVTNACRRSGLPQEPKPRRFVVEISSIDDFQCHRAVKIHVERFVRDPHRSATQLDWFPVFALHQFIMLKALHRPFRRRLDRILGSRGLAGLNPASKTLAKHADRTEFHCSRELVTAGRTGALGLRAHGPNRPSVAIRASQRAWISSSISAGSDTVRPTSSRNSAV